MHENDRVYGTATVGIDGGTNISSIGESTVLLMSCIIKLNLSGFEIIAIPHLP